MSNSIKFIDLFAGIGGIKIGFEKEGFKCVFSNDIDKYCQITFNYNFNVKSKNNNFYLEDSLVKIDIPNIRIIKNSDSFVLFEDDNNQYSFLLSKNTLNKKFLTESIICEFDVVIVEDPLDNLVNLFDNKNKTINERLK